MRTSKPRAAWVAAAAAVLVTWLGALVALAAPAAATAPETWADPDALPRLQALLLFVGVPLGLVVLISLLAAAPSIARSSRQRRDADAWAQPWWFGGPAVESGSERRALAQGSSTERTDEDAEPEPDAGGGAGARW